MNPTISHHLKPLALAITTAALLAACGGSSGGSQSPDSQTGKGWQPDSAGNVTIRFGAYNGDTPIDCSSSLKLGTTQRAVRMADFRFYIADVQLIRADGSKQPLALKTTDDYNYSSADGKHSVSLIDLEASSQGKCIQGSTTVNARIEGTAPAGLYTGVEMTLGVPFELNHLNAADASTPRVLQNTVHPAMSWSWRGGRKFTNIQFDQDKQADPAVWQTAEGDKDGQVILHLGSTGCVGNPAAGTPISSCKAPNRAAILLADFNPNTQLVAFDAGALFNHDIASTSEGDGACMSGPNDAACAKPFSALGVDWKADGSGTGQPIPAPGQQVLKAVAR